MAYEPTNWQAGDIVTSAKLNKMEQGIARYDIVEGIKANESSIITLNKTWQEIWDNNYTYIMTTYEDDYETAKQFIPIINITGPHQITKSLRTGASSDVIVRNPEYLIIVSAGTRTIAFTCDSPDAYPSYDASQEQSDSSGEDTGDGQ